MPHEAEFIRILSIMFKNPILREWGAMAPDPPPETNFLIRFHNTVDGKNPARQKPYEFIGFPIIMLKKHIKT